MDIREYKKEIRISFLVLLGFYILILIYRLFNPLDFPGLEERLLYVLVPWGVISLLIWLPYNLIIDVLKKSTENLTKRIEEINVISEETTKKIGRISILGSSILGSYKLKNKLDRLLYSLISMYRYIIRLLFKIFSLFLFLTKVILKFTLIVLQRFWVIIQKNKEDLFKITVNWLFQVLLIVFLGLLIFKEFFTLKLDLNYLLVAVIILGALSIFFPYEKKEIKKTTKKDYVFTVILAIIGAVLIFVKTKSIGWLSYIIAIITAILIYLLSNLIYEEDEKTY